MAVRTVRRICQLAVVLQATLLAVAPVVAQETKSARLDLAAAAGPSPYDLSGTGTGFAAGVWVGYPVRSFLLAEAGVGYFRYTTQFDRDVTYLLPEVGIRAGAPLGPLFPYLGGGIGFGSVITGGARTDLTLHVALGIRLWMSKRVGLRGEGRLRSVHPWAGNMVDLTGGVLIRL
jgi:hypothetical protein